MNRQIVALLIAFLCVATREFGQDATKQDSMRDCPMHNQHAADGHHTSVQEHGDQAMGFSHETTTHHFRIFASGGAIEVTANSPDDKADTGAIRSHLTHIAAMFKDGDFSAPMFIHDSIPPGTTTMKLLKEKIEYKYEEIPSGARVRIEATDPVALAAIHDFLRFQISEHQTGDDLEVNSAH